MMSEIRSQEEFEKAVRLLSDLTTKHKENEAKFKKNKGVLSELLESWWQDNVDETSVEVYSDESDADEFIKITRVQRIDVDYNAAKLESALPKELRKEVVQKRYFIDDFDGLVWYLKGCGVDPSIFKSFLKIERSIDEKALDKLWATGKVDEELLIGTYQTKEHSPYFTVRKRKATNDD